MAGCRGVPRQAAEFPRVADDVPHVRHKAPMWHLRPQWFEESAYTAHGWRTKRDRVCAGCRVALQFRHIKLRSRRRLRGRVEKTRQERRKRVLEAVRQEIETCRKKRRVMCGRCGAKIEAKTEGGLANAVSANKTNDMTCCDTCRRMQRGSGPSSLGPLADLAPFTYHCPVCNTAVNSTVGDGKVDNRQTCGHRFQVKDGHVVASETRKKICAYQCPHCQAKVDSTIKNGRIDNRRHCGHQFTVAAGAVVALGTSDQKCAYACPHCQARVESTIKDGRIDNRHDCGHRFTVAAGDVVERPTKKHMCAYKCPHCRAKIASRKRDGRIDNRRKCGHTFTVSAGKVVTTAATKER